MFVMGFGDLFSRSWKEYKENFWTIFKIFLLFSLIPLIIVRVVSLLSNAPEKTSFFDLVSLFSIVGILGLILIVSYFIMTLSYLYLSLYKKQNASMNLGQAVKGGLKYFWKYLGLSLLVVILLIPLFILLIIPGLIFSIYWVFSGYVLMGENTGIWESMKRSKLIVKGRWWTVLGYSILLALVMGLISIPLGIPGFIYSFIVGISSLGEELVLSNSQKIISLIFEVISSFSTLVTVPLAILFSKNFYLEMRANLHKEN